LGGFSNKEGGPQEGLCTVFTLGSLEGGVGVGSGVGESESEVASVASASRAYLFREEYRKEGLKRGCLVYTTVGFCGKLFVVVLLVGVGVVIGGGSGATSSGARRFIRNLLLMHRFLRIYWLKYLDLFCCITIIYIIHLKDILIKINVSKNLI